jgi:hypothetical protein
MGEDMSRIYKMIASGLLASMLALSAPAGAASGDAAGGWGGYRPGSMGYEFRRYKDRMADMVAKGTVVLGRVADRVATVIDAEIDGYKRAGDVTRSDERDGARGEAAEVASDLCSDAAQRKIGNGHVDGIDSVERDGEGWRVEGTVSAGRSGDARPFVCGVRDGKVDYVQLGDSDDLG